MGRIRYTPQSCTRGGHACCAQNRANLIPIHRHPLALPAQLAIRAWANGPAAALASVRSAGLLQSKQLLGAEALVVDLRGCFDKILQVGARQEVAQVDEFAVSLVFNVDGAPTVLTAADRLAVDGKGVFAADNREGDDGLDEVLVGRWTMCKVRALP